MNNRSTNYFIILILIVLNYSNVIASCGYGNFSLIEKLHRQDQRYEAFIFKVDSTIILSDYSYKSFGKIIENNLFKKNVEIFTGGNSTAGGEALIPDKFYFVVGGLRKDGNYSGFVCDSHSRLIADKNDSISVNNFIIKFYSDLFNHKTGKVSYSINNKLMGIGKLRSGMPDGKWKYYYNDGMLWTAVEYQNDRIIKQISYNREGIIENKTINYNLKSVTSAFNNRGKLFHQSITWTQEGWIMNNTISRDYSTLKLISNKTLLNVGNQGEKVLHGNYEEFDKKGKLIYKGHYYRGAKTGNWIEYDKKNDSLFNLEYPKIIPNESYFVYYHSNGTLASIGIMQNGLKQGLWCTFYENGDTLSVGVYLNDHKVGLWKNYYKENKTLEHIGNYVNDKKDGKWVTFKRTKDEIYHVAHYKNGKCVGESTSYFTNDLIETKVNFNEFGERHGSDIKYYKNGNIQSLWSYENNIRNGPCRKFYENGQIKEEGNYMGGFPVGVWKYYDPEGALIKSEMREKPKFKIGDPY